MSHQPEPPDPVVRTAIQLLPVPEHGAGFWDDLHARLDAEHGSAALAPAHGAVPLGPAPDRTGPGIDDVELVPLGVVPPALRRRSNAALVAVAVAAAALVVIAGGTLVGQRTDDDVATDLASSPASTAAVASSMATLTGPAADLPTETVLAWVDALGEGDTASAWASLGPASRAHFGSQSAFAAESSALAEGYGAWSGADPEHLLVTPLPSSGDGLLVVVTLVGDVQLDGATGQRADAFPVRIVDGNAKVEMWAFAGELQMVVPEDEAQGHERPTVDEDDELVVVIPRGVEAPTIRLDDGEALVCGQAAGTTLEELSGTPGQRCSYQPAGGIPVGQRVLTVAFLSPDGAAVSADAVVFEAA